MATIQSGTRAALHRTWCFPGSVSASPYAPSAWASSSAGFSPESTTRKQELDFSR